MTSPRIEQLAEGVTLWPGDCRTVLPGVEANSFDACVTDPPYGLGFMGKGWDHGVPDVAHWRAIFRVLKPGAHLLSFGGTRTFGRLWVVIEEAGFEIRDTIMWVYSQGFPKSLDVSKAIDKAAGEQRERIRGVRSGVVANTYAQDAWSLEFKDSVLSTEPITPSAREWSGYGTALKPAVEPIILARKPLEGTVAQNVLRWGVGALNIDGCRVGYSGDSDKASATPGGKCTALSGALAGKTQKADAEKEARKRGWISEQEYNGEDDGVRHPERGDWAEDWDGACSQEGISFGRSEFERPEQKGRWPANLIHDGSEEVIAAFPYRKCGDGTIIREGGADRNGNTSAAYGKESRPSGTVTPSYGDEGSAARFFYSAKADQDDRLGSRHPTIKPVDVKQYLCRLVGRKGALILDPFAGTGTTGEAAFREGMRAVLIEREEEYCADIRRRMALLLSGPEERKREGIKARNADKPADHGPLFT